MYRCKVCQTRSVNKRIFKKHIYTHFSSAILGTLKKSARRCQICKRDEFRSRDALGFHSAFVHGTIRKFIDVDGCKITEPKPKSKVTSNHMECRGRVSTGSGRGSPQVGRKPPKVRPMVASFTCKKQESFTTRVILKGPPITPASFTSKKQEASTTKVILKETPIILTHDGYSNLSCSKGDGDSVLPIATEAKQMDLDITTEEILTELASKHRTFSDWKPMNIGWLENPFDPDMEPGSDPLLPGWDKDMPGLDDILPGWDIDMVDPVGIDWSPPIDPHNKFFPPLELQDLWDSTLDTDDCT